MTAARCGRLPGQDAVVSLERAARLMRGARLMRRAYLDGGADLGLTDLRRKAALMARVDLTRVGIT